MGKSTNYLYLFSLECHRFSHKRDDVGGSLLYDKKPAFCESDFVFVSRLVIPKDIPQYVDLFRVHQSCCGFHHPSEYFLGFGG